MDTFVRAVISGFGFTLGKALFEVVRDHFKPDEEKGNDTAKTRRPSDDSSDSIDVDEELIDDDGNDGDVNKTDHPGSVH